MKDLKNITIEDLAPSNLLKDDGVNFSAQAIDPQLQLVAELVPMALIYARASELTSLQMDHLAAQFHFTEWDSSWDLDQKYKVLMALVETKRRAGTLYKVKTAVSCFCEPFTITEWWETEPKGDPYTYEIEIPLDEIGKEFTFADQEALEGLIYEAKSIRSHGGLKLKRCTNAPIVTASMLRSCVFARL